MADRTHDIPELDVDQAELEIRQNEINQAASPAIGLGLNQGEMTGLHVELFAGVALNTSGAPTKITSGLSFNLTDDATNYVSLEPGSPPTIAVVSSAPSGWPGPLASGGIALYDFVAADGAITNWTDYRLAPGIAAPAVGSITGLGTGVATFLATPSSANLASAITDETGSGALVFATAPTLGVVTADAYKVSSTGHILDTGTSRTLSGTDNGTFIHFSSGSSITLNMAGSLGAFACTIIQEGAGQITFAANSQTMTVAGGNTKTAGAGSMATIISRTSGTFWIDGRLA